MPHTDFWEQRGQPARPWAACTELAPGSRAGLSAREKQDSCPTKAKHALRDVRCCHSTKASGPVMGAQHPPEVGS